MQHPPPGTRFLSYIRFSSKPQERGQSVERQTALARRYADDYKLRLDTSTYADLGVSAFRPSPKAGSALAALVAAVEAGKIPKGSVIGIEQLDRWSRAAPLDALNSFQKVLRKGVGIVTLTDRRYWTMAALSDLNGLLSAILTMSRSHEESAAKSDRLRAAWASKRKRAAAGTVHTRMSPGWLSWDGKAWVVDRKRAAVVVKVFALAAEGYGLVSISNRMNRERVAPPTRRGTSWHPSTVAKLLASPSVIGTLQVGHRSTTDTGQVHRVIDAEIAAYYPVILSKRLWLATRSTARPRPPVGAARAGRVVNLLASVAICGRCRSPMHYVNKGSGRQGGAYLICSNARRGLCKASRGWRYPELEALLVQLVHRLVKWETLVPRQQTQYRSALTKAEEALASVQVEQEATALRLKRITDAIEAGAKVQPLVDRMMALQESRLQLGQQAEDLRGAVENERERVRGLRADVQESRAVFKDWQSGKLKADPDVRHRLAVVIRKMLTTVVLTTTKNGHGPSREPRRLELRWRDPHEEPVTCVVSSDLREAQDTSDGEVVVKMGPLGATVVSKPGVHGGSKAGSR